LNRVISTDDEPFLAEVAVEAIGWVPLEAHAYVHLDKPGEAELVITIVGLPDADMAAMNVLLLT
jgi:hypothetical protein